MDDNMVVKTATGKQFQIRFMGATSIGVTSVLYIEIMGSSMTNIIPVFTDKNETFVLEGIVDGEPVKQFKGYTNLIEAIVLADSGNIRIALTAAVDAIGEVI